MKMDVLRSASDLLTEQWRELAIVSKRAGLCYDSYHWFCHRGRDFLLQALALADNLNAGRELPALDSNHWYGVEHQLFDDPRAQNERLGNFATFYPRTNATIILSGARHIERAICPTIDYVIQVAKDLIYVEQCGTGQRDLKEVFRLLGQDKSTLWLAKGQPVENHELHWSKY